MVSEWVRIGNCYLEEKLVWRRDVGPATGACQYWKLKCTQILIMNTVDVYVFGASKTQVFKRIFNATQPLWSGPWIGETEWKLLMKVERI